MSTGVGPYVLGVWLQQHPHAMVAAFSPEGKPVPMPDGVPLLATHQIDERSFLSLVASSETTAVVNAFNEALQSGVSVNEIRMADGRSVALHYADVRDTHGVVLRMVLPHDDGRSSGPLTALDLVAARPRFAVVHKSERSVIVAIDDATEQLLGWVPEEMIGRPTLDFIHPEDHPRAIDNWMAMIASGDNHSVRVRMRTKGAEWMWFETSNEFRFAADGERQVVCQMIDISEEMATSEALRYSEQLLRRVAETVPVGPAELGRDEEVRYVNSSLRAMLSEHKLESLEELKASLGPADRASLAAAIARALHDGMDSDVDLRVPGRGFIADRLVRVSLRALTDGSDVLGALLCVIDVTELKIQASTDPLTGLQNRASIVSALEGALSDQEMVGVIFMDLDRFKPINDRFGHETGDNVLARVAAALSSAVPDDDIVGRVGGDEFVVVSRRLSGPEATMELAGRLQDAVAAELAEFAVSVSTAASVGVACVRGRTTSAAEAIARADAAMYQAKRSPSGRPVLWTDGPVRRRRSDQERRPASSSPSRT